MNTQGEGWRTIIQSESTLPPSRAFSSSAGSVSAVTVRTNGPEDYGTVTCNARNDRGWMMKPCVFETVPSEETLAVLVIGGHNVRGSLPSLAQSVAALCYVMIQNSVLQSRPTLPSSLPPRSCT